MNLTTTIWRFVAVLLSFPINERCFLLPVCCQRFNGLGYLTVEPAQPFLIGSNLTVYCHIQRCQPSFQISLELNKKMVNSWRKVNCTTTIFSLFNVQKPQSIVLCKLKSAQLSKVVSGLDLRVPPDKPENILCETSKNSDLIDCSWKKGRDTHLNTTYYISLCSKDGTRIMSDQIQGASEISIKRGTLEEEAAYQLTITADNHFGASQSDPLVFCVKDIMIPETPRIVKLEFRNNSAAAVLQRNTSESSENLTTNVRLRKDNGSWEAWEGTDVSVGLIQIDRLRPLTDYEFQVRVCNSLPNSTCSKWSPSVTGTSPGKGPSKPMLVWRTLGGLETDGQQMVKVLWKPPPPDDHSGDVQYYKILVGDEHKKEVTCNTSSSQWSVKLTAEVQALSVSAVTLYGTSPPADVPLRHSGDVGPVLRELTPENGVVFVSWYKHQSTSGGNLLHYVLEWTRVTMTTPCWQKVAKDQNSTFITGLTAGVRYNISLYAVTSRGVSAPSSRLVYSEEEKPESGPNMSVLVHEAKRIRIQWDELPVDKQKGFILNYIIYLQTDNNNEELKVPTAGQISGLWVPSMSLSASLCGVMVPASSPREMWLNCPEGALALQLAASNSAGEGQRGNRVCSQPERPAVGLVIVLVFVVTIFAGIIGNLMCWSCVRERIKQKCISWGPAWLDEKLPKPGNSNAIKLLQQDRSELSFSSSHVDPPLSPISLISEERDDVYPIIHVEISESTKPSAETPLLISDSETMQVEHGYKPQVIMSEMKETEEEQQDVPSSGEEDRCVFGGLLGDFLSSVEEDFTNPPVGLNLCSVGGLLWPKNTETTSFLNVLRKSLTEKDLEEDSPFLDLQQCDIMTPNSGDTKQSQYTAEARRTGGYFPQAASVINTALCDTQR